MLLAATLSPSQWLFLIQYEVLFVLQVLTLIGIGYLIYRWVRKD